MSSFEPLPYLKNAGLKSCVLFLQKSQSILKAQQGLTSSKKPFCSVSSPTDAISSGCPLVNTTVDYRCTGPCTTGWNNRCGFTSESLVSLISCLRLVTVPSTFIVLLEPDCPCSRTVPLSSGEDGRHSPSRSLADSGYSRFLNSVADFQWFTDRRIPEGWALLTQTVNWYRWLLLAKR